MKIEKIANSDKPENDEIEITTIGAGGSIGESIVIHLGDNRWAIVDSCKDPYNGKIIPLEYLKSIKVPFENVDLVICSHWHKDHILGLPEIIKKCKPEKFYFGEVGQNNNLLKLLVAQDYKETRGTFKEFINSIHAAKACKANIQYGMKDKMIYNDKDKQLFCLSPSDALLNRMFNKLIKFNPKKDDLDSMKDSSVFFNLSSIALLLVCPQGNILLGADMQTMRNEQDDIFSCEKDCDNKKDWGWCNIVDGSSSAFKPKCKISMFKLPHHSSKTGFCAKLWNQNMSFDTILTSTVFINNKGIMLPTPSMLEMYHTKSKFYFLTGNSALKGRDINGKMDIDKNRIYIETSKVINNETGIISCRKRQGEDWKINYYGKATEVTDSFIKNYKNVYKSYYI